MILHAEQTGTRPDGARAPAIGAGTKLFAQARIVDDGAVDDGTCVNATADGERDL